MKNIINTLKKGFTKTILPIGLGLTMLGCSGHTVYKGKISNNQDITYKEGVLGVSLEHTNKMYIHKNGIHYDFIDYSNNTKLHWESEQKQNLHLDKLEKVKIDDGTNKKTYRVSEINDKTSYGKHVGKVFAISDSIYNNIRSEIWDKLNENYQFFQEARENDRQHIEKGIKSIKTSLN